jgi:2-keto-4-pentenoate hydratase/2-oxohepta-3-ene-1,7-dioic acid hydratase in catechol pathway
MKLASYDDFKVGVVSDGQVRDITRLLPFALDTVPRQRMPWLIENWSDLRGEVEEAYPRSLPRPLDAVQLLAPIPVPGHIFAAPTNYQRRLAELDEAAVKRMRRSVREQGFSLKAPGSVVGAGQVISLPKGTYRRFDHESELAIIVGKHGSNIPRAQALEYVFGYSCLIDITMRMEPREGEEELSMRKSFATFTPIGPWIVTADEMGDPSSLSNRLYVNDEVRHDANTRDMIIGIAELVEQVSSALPIKPGDIIATGSPEGAGPIAPGDRIRIVIERVGEMTMQVEEATATGPYSY